MARPPEKHWRILPILTVVFLAAALFLLPRAPREAPRRPSNPPPGIASSFVHAVSAIDPLPAPRRLAAFPSPVPVRQSLHAAIESMLALLRKGSAGTHQAALLQLKQLLESSPLAEAIPAIREFLASNQDATTSMVYAVGSGGRLQTAPSLRTFLLDELGFLCKRGGDSQASLAVAQEILASPTSADEWSLALRNVAWASPDSAAFLNAKFRELLGQSQWLQNPSPGVLEAFDVPVYTQDPASISLLVPLLSQQPETASSLSRAAAVALDRLAEQSPLAVMNYLNSNTAVLSDMGMMRADYFSKANLSDPSQRVALETYFARTDVTDAEKAKSVEGLFSPGSFVSDNLLTSTPPAPDPALQMQILGQFANEWSKRFPKVGLQVKRLLQQSN